jgi:tripartite-type tricarboxylate transporter receptor subunit TctC
MSTCILRLMPRVLVAAAAMASLIAPARADDYPSKVITILVPFGAGSGSDIAARFYARALKEHLNANSIVELKPGAAGMIAGQMGAKAAPDGYTVLMGSGTVNAANYPLFRDRIGYRPDQYATVATIYVTPPLLLAAKELPGATLKELIGHAQRTQGKLSCGSGNAVTQVACELLRRKTGADIVNVPYKGNGQSMTDLAGGQIAIAFSDMAAAGPFVARAAVRPIATPTAVRLPSMPDLPTFAEQGVGDFEFLSWNTIFVPAGTPADVIRKLNAAARHMLASEEWEKQRIATSGIKVSGDLKESEAFVASELDRWDRYVRETGVTGSQ